MIWWVGLNSRRLLVYGNRGHIIIIMIVFKNLLLTVARNHADFSVKTIITLDLPSNDSVREQ